MGVPALFRWLSNKYPKTVSPVLEEGVDVEFGKVPQYLDANPNGELDNLYLDMNGIVHPCTHPEGKRAPETEDEMFLEIFKYTDRVLMMARPRKVLVIAVDGVAPRAKMNQQRSRRFRAAKDALAEKEARLEEIQRAEAMGEHIDNAVKDTKRWDSNVITPGTPFMDGLAIALRYWVAYKLALDSGWKDLQVVISDSTVPGEGEHKLMSFIRSQRLDPSYDPNTKHCIYGLDADLIFLGLATHEPHFRVLREDVFFQGIALRDTYYSGGQDHTVVNGTRQGKPFLWLHVNVLREYLAYELYINNDFWELERAIDDWVFMCFFVGNDFLPHMPALSVKDSGIEILLRSWRKVMAERKKFITCDGKLDLDGVQMLLALVSEEESGILLQRYHRERAFENRKRRQNNRREEETVLRKQYLSTVSKGKEKAPLVADKTMPLMDTSGKLVDGYAQLLNSDIVQNRGTITKANMANADAAASLKKLLAEKSGEGPISVSQTPKVSDSCEDSTAESAIHAAAVFATDDDPDGSGDSVRLHEDGYRERYYRQKFKVKTCEEMEKTRRDVIHAYLEGISWVLLYYLQGCPSWEWYYPYHYAPFAADFFDMRSVVEEKPIFFELGKPFRPFEQLMAVLPAASGHALPEVLRDLMSNPDSEIIDFYPENFEVDMNGAKASWMGISLLPFIDQHRLLTAVSAKYPLLTEAEMIRNTNKVAQLYVSKDNENYKRFLDARYSDKEIVIAARKTGLAGKIQTVDTFSEKAILKFPFEAGEMPDISNSAYLPTWYKLPDHQPGKSMLLGGYIPHVDLTTQQDRDTIHNMDAMRKYKHFENSSNYVNTGPAGDKAFMMYRMRVGGYRSLLSGRPIPAPTGHGTYRAEHRSGGYSSSGYENKRGYSSQYDTNKRGHYGQNQSYFQKQGYNRNQGYHENQSYGQNQGYNLNFQGDNQGYNQGYNQGNQGHKRENYQYQNRQNYNHSRSNYQNNHPHHHHQNNHQRTYNNHIQNNQSSVQNNQLSRDGNNNQFDDRRSSGYQKFSAQDRRQPYR